VRATRERRCLAERETELGEAAAVDFSQRGIVHELLGDEV
jgi:hypothetical protein